jgi:flavin reductase (DIM6/NTAB) family NADH-FMN oxidoreductase RutF
MIIDFEKEAPLTRYHLLTQTVMPRPIAWVLSANDDTSLNLAPFSFFNVICSDPPLLVLSIGKKTTGEPKDTRRNITSGRDFVVHIGSFQQAAAINQSAAVLAYGESEVAASDLPLADFPGCALPRLADCAVAYQCALYEVHELGPNQQAVIYAEIMRLYLNDEVVTQKDKRFIIDAEKVNPLARLGGTEYAALGEVFSLLRPN